MQYQVVTMIFGLQVLCIQQSEILAMNNIENNMFINFNISEISEHEFENKEQLEIIPSSIFSSWKQIDYYIKMYMKQNGFVSIIIRSESYEMPICLWTLRHKSFKAYCYSGASKTITHQMIRM